MCTELTYKNGKYAFMGRNYDCEISYDETVTVTPRNYPFSFSNLDAQDSHYAIMGITANILDYPLYYDAVNEKGLAMAGLNFPGNAHYTKPADKKINLSSFELIPYLLSNYARIDEVKKDISDFNITDESYSKKLPKSPPAHDGQYSWGMGSIDLPCDLSSMGRFATAVWMKNNSKTINGSYSECLSQFYHILASVEQIYGCTQLDEDEFEYTIYTDCYDLNGCILYYKDYYQFAPAKYRMYDHDLDGDEIFRIKINR